MNSLVSNALDGFNTYTTNRCARRRLLLLLLGYGFMANSQPVSAADCVPRPAGLVSWWRAEANALDQAGTNNGTIAGNTTFSPSRVGQGFAFDGNGAVVRLGNPANLHFQDLTIETWISRASTAVASLNGNGNGVIFGYHIGGYGLYMDPSGTPTLSKIGIDEVKPGVTITDTNLHHVAVTKSGSTVVFYVDGVAYSAAAYDPGFTFSENAYIGGLENQYTFYGTVDEVSVYSRALAASEILAVYNAGSAGKCVPVSPPSCAPAPLGLVSWWRAEQDAVDALGSNSGQALNGVHYTNGPVGAAFYFDGVDDRIIVSNSPSLNFGPGADFSIEAWIKPELATTDFGVQSIANKRYTPNSFAAVGWEFGLIDGKLACQLADAPLTPGDFSTFVSAGPDLRDGNYHHVALSLQRASTSGGKLLVDGQVVLTFDPTVQPGDLGSEEPLRVGAHAGATLNSHFTGAVDEVSIYNRAVSANEISGIYAAGSAGKCVVSNPPPVSPVIVSQPTNVTVYVGSNAAFRVTATSATPLTYQWRFNGNDLPGKTANLLSLTSAQFSNAGPYSVVVNYAGGSITSSPAMLTVKPLPECVPPPAGLVSWWRAEGDATDNWGTNNGTRFGTTFAPGKVGQAFSVPRISAADALSLRATNGLTLEAWVNPISFRNPGPQTIISKFDWPFAPPVGTQSAYLLGFTNNGRLFFTVSATGSARTNTALLTTQTLPTNQWSFVVATYDGAALRIYLNGTLAAQTNYSAGIFPGTAPLGLGAIFMNAQFSDVSWPFNGLLDEISLYNRALTDGEIQAIYNADVVGKCLVAPTIVTQPQDQAIPLGEDVKFTAAVLGSRPLKYQWRFNGAVIAGATNAALVLEKVKTNQAGLYHMAVTNAAGFAVSARAQLSLLSAPTCTETPAGLISWWPGDSNSADAMGTNNITLFSPTRYVTGKADRAFSFDGMTSRITVPSSAGLNFGSNADFSIEMWIKAGASNTVYPNVPLVEKIGNDGTLAVPGYSLALNQGRLAFALGLFEWSPGRPPGKYPALTFISSGPDLRDAFFHHVAVSVSRKATNGGNLYVDGQLVLTFDPTSRNVSLANTGPLYIGAPSKTVSSSYFGGLIDEPAIYNRALTAEEILAIRQAGAAGKCKVKPSILVQPASQRVTLGSNVTFSVTAGGTPLLRYQWLAFQGTAFGATNSSYSFKAKSGGVISVRVTNLFGSVTSANALLTINTVPTAMGAAVTLNEERPTGIELRGTDRENDPLIYRIVTPPAHGSLSGTGSNVVYAPSPNYNGPDSFTFKVNDGLVDSAPATVSLTILPVNDPPVALSQLVTLNEDTAIPITLGAYDADGDTLTYSVIPPAHGTLSGVAPNLHYTPATNYFGSDLFTFTVMDPSNAVSQLAAVSITVHPVNDAPVARIEVAPLDELPGITNLVAIAPVCCEATLRLDASKSTDVDNDALTYTWLEGTNILSTEVVVTNRFQPGTHEFTLLVNDGKDVTAAFVTVEIITSAEAVAFLKGLVEAGIPEHRDRVPLVNWLRESGKAFDRCKVDQGVKFLELFNDRVQDRIAPTDPELATALMETATAIIEAAPDCDPCHRLGRHHHKRGKDKERDGRGERDDQGRAGRDERDPGDRSERDDQTSRPGVRATDPEVRVERSSPGSR